MDSKTKLEVLEKQIREYLPRLLEITKGCNLKHKETNIYSQIVCSSDSLFYIFNGVNVMEYHKNEIVEYFEIIGHNIQLNDLLEWLQKFNTTDTYFSTSEFSISVRYHNGIVVDRKFIKWGLSKPYLKDQSEELLNFLYNLI